MSLTIDIISHCVYLLSTVSDMYIELYRLLSYLTDGNSSVIINLPQNYQICQGGLNEYGRAAHPVKVIADGTLFEGFHSS